MLTRKRNAKGATDRFVVKRKFVCRIVLSFLKKVFCICVQRTQKGPTTGSAAKDLCGLPSARWERQASAPGIAGVRTAS